MTQPPKTPEIAPEGMQEGKEEETQQVLTPHEVIPEAMEEAKQVRLVAMTERKELMDEMDQDVIRNRLQSLREIPGGSMAA